MTGNNLNKRAMSIAIVILVIATLFITGFAIFTFDKKQIFVQENLQNARFLENVYFKEKQLNYYVSDIIEKTADKDAIIFVSNFKKELERYKQGGEFIIPELEQIKSQIDEKKVLISGNKLSIEFQITFRESVQSQDENKQLLYAVHSYKKTFEKIIV